MFLEPEKSLNLFSSTGKLTQRDNALKAALNSALALGCAAADGVVLVSSKALSPLVDKANFHKVFTVCPSIGVTYSGLQPDFRAQLAVAQRICQDYFDVYERFPDLGVFVDEFCLTVQAYSQKGGLRPFGTFLIFCGADGAGPCCYQMDPTGSYARREVVATGKNYEEAKKFVERRREGVDDNVVSGVQAIRELGKTEMKPEDLSVGVFREGKFTVYAEEGVREIFDSLGLV